MIVEFVISCVTQNLMNGTSQYSYHVSHESIRRDTIELTRYLPVPSVTHALDPVRLRNGYVNVRHTCPLLTHYTSVIRTFLTLLI